MKYFRDVGIVALGAGGLALLVAWETDFGWGAILRGVGVFALGLAIVPALAGEHGARHAPALFWSNPLADVLEQAERDEAAMVAWERREGRRVDLNEGCLGEVQAWWASRVLPVALVMLTVGWWLG